MTTTAAPVSAKPKVRWGRVALFYGLAFGWVALVAAGLFAIGVRDLSSPQGPTLATVVVAIFYMPAPLVAALIVNRLDGRPSGLRAVFAGFRRVLPRLVVIAVSVGAALLLAMLGISWLLGNAVGVEQSGKVLTSHDDLVANALRLLGSMDSSQVDALSAGMPALWLMLLLALVGGLVAGFTVNGLFAFGEEFGWRGWLADELRPIGAFWANVLTGVLWGLWHAPLILLGFNYGSYAKIGTAFMIAWCIPLSFLLWRVRQVSGSVLGPAVAHGAINGFAGVFTIVLYDANPLIAVPVGLAGAFATAVVAAVFWFVTRGRVQPGVLTRTAGDGS